MFVTEANRKIIGGRIRCWISILQSQAEILKVLSQSRDHSCLRCSALQACKKKHQQELFEPNISPRASGDIAVLNPEQQQANQSLSSIYKAKRKPRCSKKILMASGLADGEWWNSQKQCGNILLLLLLFFPCHCHVTIKKECEVPVFTFWWYVLLLLWFSLDSSQFSWWSNSVFSTMNNFS